MYQIPASPFCSKYNAAIFLPFGDITVTFCEKAEKEHKINRIAFNFNFVIIRYKWLINVLKVNPVY
jgi:hypothetical protein